MHIRTALPEDALAIVQMTVAFRNHLERVTPTHEQFAESIAKLLASSDAQFFMATHGG